MLGHEKFARDVWSRFPSLFSQTNKDGETPLIAALMAGNDTLSGDMLSAASRHLQPDTEGRKPLNEMLLKIDNHGNNVLHHAIRNGFEDFALVLLCIEPLLSEDVELRQLENFEKQLLEDRVMRLPEDLEQELSKDRDLPLPLPPLPPLPPPPPPPLSQDEDSWHPMSSSTELSQSESPEPLPSPSSGDKDSCHPVLRDDHKISESPMFMAARKGYIKLVKRLLEIPSSVEYGPRGYSALEAAADDTGIFEILLTARPKLAHRITGGGLTPLTACIGELKTVKKLLEYDPFLAYDENRGEAHGGSTPFLVAAELGLVSVAEEIMTACPDSAYLTNKKTMANALHIAIRYEQESFVDFILKKPQLHRLINQFDRKGQLPLHIAAEMCNPQILRSLILHKRQDRTAINANCRRAVDIVCQKNSLWKTLKWNISFTLVTNKISNGWRNMIIYITKGRIQQQAIKEVKSLTARNTKNTSLIAILLATVTFAAAFTVPGGFSNDLSDSDAGVPIFAKKVAFQVFLISDTIAMCSSLAVAFLCILATWEDLDYLLNYRKTTRPLMWCAYTATAVAFGTGVFTVMAHKRLWLAIPILVLSCILPFLSLIIGEWPKISFRLRFGRRFQSNLLPNL